jgi:hypothetical protein
VGKFIEDHGYEAMPNKNTGAQGRISDMDGTIGKTLSPEEQIGYQKRTTTRTPHHRSVKYGPAGA